MYLFERLSKYQELRILIHQNPYVKFNVLRFSGKLIADVSLDLLDSNKYRSRVPLLEENEIELLNK